MDLSEFLFNSINEFFKTERSKDKNVIFDEFEKFIREKFKNELEKIDNQVDEMKYGFFCNIFKNRDNKILSPDEYKFYKSKVQKEKLKYKDDDIFKEFGFTNEEIKLLKEIENADFKFSFDLLNYLKEEKDAGFDIEESLKDIGIDIKMIKILKDYEPIKFFENGKKLNLKNINYSITDNSLKVYYVDEDGDEDFIFLNYPNYKFNKDILEISSGVYILQFKRRRYVKR